jgi:hypothetical protein
MVYPVFTADLFSEDVESTTMFCAKNSDGWNIMEK